MLGMNLFQSDYVEAKLIAQERRFEKANICKSANQLSFADDFIASYKESTAGYSVIASVYRCFQERSIFQNPVKFGKAMLSKVINYISFTRFSKQQLETVQSGSYQQHLKDMKQFDDSIELKVFYEKLHICEPVKNIEFKQPHIGQLIKYYEDNRGLFGRIIGYNGTKHIIKLYVSQQKRDSDRKWKRQDFIQDHHNLFVKAIYLRSSLDSHVLYFIQKEITAGPILDLSNFLTLMLGKGRKQFVFDAKYNATAESNKDTKGIQYASCFKSYRPDCLKSMGFNYAKLYDKGIHTGWVKIHCGLGVETTDSECLLIKSVDAKLGQCIVTYYSLLQYVIVYTVCTGYDINYKLLNSENEIEEIIANASSDQYRVCSEYENMVVNKDIFMLNMISGEKEIQIENLCVQRCFSVRDVKESNLQQLSALREPNNKIEYHFCDVEGELTNPVFKQRRISNAIWKWVGDKSQLPEDVRKRRVNVREVGLWIDGTTNKNGGPTEDVGLCPFANNNFYNF